MARNGLAGSTKGTSKSARYYQSNPKARAVKDKYNTKYHKQKRSIKYRSLLNKKKPAGDGMDNAHYGSGGKTKRMSSSKNRANNRPKYRATKAPMKSLLKKRNG